MTLFLLLVIYGVLVLAVAALAVLKSTSLFTYGKTFGAFFATAGFWGIFVLILVATGSALASVDWTTPLFNTETFFQAPF